MLIPQLMGTFLRQSPRCVHLPINSSKHFIHPHPSILASDLYFSKGVVHGVLTNGCDWIFVMIHFDHNNDGASYKITIPFKLVSTPAEDAELVPDMIAGILSHWVR